MNKSTKRIKANHIDQLEYAGFQKGRIRKKIRRMKTTHPPPGTFLTPSSLAIKIKNNMRRTMIKIASQKAYLLL